MHEEKFELQIPGAMWSDDSDATQRQGFVGREKLLRVIHLSNCLVPKSCGGMLLDPVGGVVVGTGLYGTVHYSSLWLNVLRS